MTINLDKFIKVEKAYGSMLPKDILVTKYVENCKFGLAY